MVILGAQLEIAHDNCDLCACYDEYDKDQQQETEDIVELRTKWFSGRVVWRWDNICNFKTIFTSVSNNLINKNPRMESYQYNPYLAAPDGAKWRRE